MEAVQKQCSTCKQFYLATRENFSPHKLTKDNLETRCKACIREKNHRYLENNREKEKARKKKWREANPDKVQAYNKEYRTNNPEKVRLAVKRWSDTNHEYVLNYNKHYRETNREKERIRGRQYYWDNRERQLTNTKRWREANPERVRELDREWKAKNPEKALIIKQRRAARKHNLPDNFTNADYDYMMHYWENHCAICGRQACDGLIIVLDHWIALGDVRPNNPGTVPYNMLPLCHSTKRGMGGCNNQKWMLDPIEWILSKYSVQEAERILYRIEAYFKSTEILD